MNTQHITIHQDKTLLEGLDQMNKIHYVEQMSRLILFVFDNNQSIIGSITDGDIRRALVKTKSLDLKIGSICNPNFHFEWFTDGYLDLSKYLKNDIKIIPLLDKNKRLVEVIDVSKKRAILPLECVIMAGGRGKRLSPLTDSVPKPMLLLGDKPIIEHNIDRLVSFGIKKIYISVKYLGEQLEHYFGDGSSKGIKIEYIWENEPLGTGGALSLLQGCESKNLLVMNSDLFTDVNFEDLYLDLINENADMVVASTEYKVDVPFAVFETKDHKVQSFKEKPSYIYHSNAGVYLFKTSLINKIPKNQFYNLTDLMEEIVQEGGKLIHNPILGYWIDIGSPIDYQRAQEFIKHSRL